MNTIGRMLWVAPSTALCWVRNFALKVYEKSTLQGGMVVKLDEMRHFLRDHFIILFAVLLILI
ncbi:MAG: hypothetical protein LBJ95_01375 [Oscillospiraceae bacterium]|jgi:hypothetical protein|nr:hypothetical protein [Oscillospiraceae bacterium]